MNLSTLIKGFMVLVSLIAIGFLIKFLQVDAGFNHMHRFLPALMIRGGGEVVSVEVNHRAREHGTSKYGVWNRLWVGIVDVRGVMWLIRRPVRPVVEQLKRPDV